MIGQIKPKTAATDNRVADRRPFPDHCREQIAGTINDLHALSRRGLWGILMFMSLSAIALYCSQSGLLARVPAEIKELFGEAPPPRFLHAALAVSWLSAFVLIIGRRGGDGKPGYDWCNIGLPTAFYPLYIFSDQAGSYFPAVFAAGLLLLVIEHVTVMRYAARAIREETARLKGMQRAE